MSRSASLAGALAALVLVVAVADAQGRFPGVGRPATPAEVRAWDIDVRADFAGLPAGSGSVAKGQEVWDGKCASCHGTFGESTQVFPPIVGGTRKEDVAAGRVAALRSPSERRTTLMKLATLSTLWDYVNRAMPWNEPKTLTIEEVYAVVAYILHMGDLVPAEFVLSDANVREAQRRLPNRDGMTREHGLWDVRGRPDVANTACMRDCPGGTRVTSAIPEHARNTHGNLMQQHRVVGPVRGADTTRPPPASAGEAKDLARRALAALAVAEGAAGGFDLAKKHACVACHALEQRLVGPSFKEIGGRYRGTAAGASAVAAKILAGGVGAWGPVPMPPQPQVSEAEAGALARWIIAEAQ
jgi:cytochrome c